MTTATPTGATREDAAPLEAPDDGWAARDVAVLEAALERCVDALTGTAVRAGDRVGWLTWDLGPEGRPERLVGGRACLYDGDAGVAWALAQLARATGRTDLLDLAARAARTADVASRRAGGGGGLLDGAAGVAVALAAVQEVVADRPAPSAAPLGARLPAAASIAASDLTSGLAGLLLARARTRALGPETLVAVEELQRRSRRGPIGVAWPDPTTPDPVEGRPLCGLSHGNSGIALALVEAAAVHPACARPALALAAEALRWEAAWFDPVRGGWPDLRGSEPSYPALWCHGAAGIAATRLRLGRLLREGLDVDAGDGLDSEGALSADTLRAEAEEGVRACGVELARAVGAVAHMGEAALAGGLTLCHGLGGPIDVLLLAHDEWGVTEHLDAARHLAAAVVDALDPDPLTWPAGVRASGSTGLFVGLAGVAVVLARLVRPGTGVASPSLLR